MEAQYRFELDPKNATPEMIREFEDALRDYRVPLMAYVNSYNASRRFAFSIFKLAMEQHLAKKRP
jgi:hypothetical protein